MFPLRYFAPDYFAPWYFAESGQVIIVVAGNSIAGITIVSRPVATTITQLLTSAAINIMAQPITALTQIVISASVTLPARPVSTIN